MELVISEGYTLVEKHGFMVLVSKEYRLVEKYRFPPQRLKIIFFWILHLTPSLPTLHLMNIC